MADTKYFDFSNYETHKGFNVFRPLSNFCCKTRVKLVVEGEENISSFLAKDLFDDFELLLEKLESIEGKVYISIDMDVIESSVLFDTNTNDWEYKDGWWYYKEPLKKGKNTENLLNKMKIFFIKRDKLKHKKLKQKLKKLK